MQLSTVADAVDAFVFFARVEAPAHLSKSPLAMTARSRAYESRPIGRAGSDGRPAISATATSRADGIAEAVLRADRLTAGGTALPLPGGKRRYCPP